MHLNINLLKGYQLPKFSPRDLRSLQIELLAGAAATSPRHPLFIFIFEKFENNFIFNFNLFLNSIKKLILFCHVRNINKKRNFKRNMIIIIILKLS